MAAREAKVNEDIEWVTNETIRAKEEKERLDKMRVETEEAHAEAKKILQQHELALAQAIDQEMRAKELEKKLRAEQLDLASRVSEIEEREKAYNEAEKELNEKKQSLAQEMEEIGSTTNLWFAEDHSFIHFDILLFNGHKYSEYAERMKKQVEADKEKLKADRELMLQERGEIKCIPIWRAHTRTPQAPVCAHWLTHRHTQIPKYGGQ